jgi:Mg2+-importing ATPase
MSVLDISSEDLEQLYVQLQTSETGLSSSSAQKKIAEQAKNIKHESSSKKELALFGRQFTNPLVLLLVAAVILSAILGESSDSLIIFLILIVTGLIGYWQESNAGRAMEKLRSFIEMKHTVLRDGIQVVVPTKEVVKGDIILLDAGDMIPADCRIVESNELHVNESTLTGESFPLEKMAGQVAENEPLAKKINCLWQGTNVISGTARVLVVATGSETLYGQMVHSLMQIPETGFEKGIRRFGYFLLRITIVLSLAILIGNLYFKKPLFDAVLFSLALAIGMAPELLPAVMTFSMSAGAKRMLKKKVIVKRLSSIFNFGEVNVLCTDKTGTITEGKVTVSDIVNMAGQSSDKLRLYACLNATLQNGFTNPIDQAITSMHINLDAYKKVNEIPYDFIRKRLSVAVTTETENIMIMKGACTNVLEVCHFVETKEGLQEILGEESRNRILDLFRSYSTRGFRVLGLAAKSVGQHKINRDDEKDMTFLGFILLEDPMKQSSIDSLKQLEDMNVQVKIITGDNRYAAAHAAGQTGLMEPGIITGEDMNRLSPEALVVKAKTTDIFAEIEPHQKELIVKALQKSNQAVAYIGDGINDVAAINAADIGISTENAVDVAKEAADFVLLEKDLSVLADGIIEGRKSFVNSMKYIFITTGATFGNMFSIAGASIFLPFLPMLPKQILLNNLISDLPFLTIASDHADKEQLLKPGKWDLKLIRNFMIVFGLHSSIFDFITFYLLYYLYKLPASQFQSGWFIESTITELLILFIIRTRKPFIKSKPGKLLTITGILALIITIALPFSPLSNVLGLSTIPGKTAVAIALILLAYFITAEIVKILFFRASERRALEVSKR